MLHRLAVGLRRFFKFSTGKNRLPVSKCAQVVAVPEGKEKISEGDKCEPKGSQENYNLDWDALRKMTDTELIADGWRPEDDCWLKPAFPKHAGSYIFSR